MIQNEQDWLDMFIGARDFIKGKLVAATANALIIQYPGTWDQLAVETQIGNLLSSFENKNIEVELARTEDGVRWTGLVNGDFPFEEIRQEDGNFFNTAQQAIDAGYDVDQVWAVTESDGSWTYGPSHHWVNLIGFVATRERHDGDVYFFEVSDTDEDEDNEENE